MNRREVLGGLLERDGEVPLHADGITQVADAIASLGQHLVRARESLFHLVAGRLSLRNALHRRMEGEDQALESLQESVVELARDPLALEEPLLQPGLDLLPHPLDSQADQERQRRDRRQDTEREEPSRLVPRGRDGERERCAIAIPDAILVSRGHLESLAAGPEAGGA